MQACCVQVTAQTTLLQTVGQTSGHAAQPACTATHAATITTSRLCAAPVPRREQQPFTLPRTVPVLLLLRRLLVTPCCCRVDRIPPTTRVPLLLLRLLGRDRGVVSPSCRCWWWGAREARRPGAVAPRCCCCCWWSRPVGLLTGRLPVPARVPRLLLLLLWVAIWVVAPHASCPIGCGTTVGRGLLAVACRKDNADGARQCVSQARLMAAACVIQVCAAQTDTSVVDRTG